MTVAKVTTLVLKPMPVGEPVTALQIDARLKMLATPHKPGVSPLSSGVQRRILAEAVADELNSKLAGVVSPAAVSAAGTAVNQRATDVSKAIADQVEATIAHATVSQSGSPSLAKVARLYLTAQHIYIKVLAATEGRGEHERFSGVLALVSTVERKAWEQVLAEAKDALFGATPQEGIDAVRRLKRQLQPILGPERTKQLLDFARSDLEIERADAMLTPEARKAAAPRYYEPLEAPTAKGISLRRDTKPGSPQLAQMGKINL